MPAIQALIWRVHINPTGLDWRRFTVATDEGGELVGCGQIKPHPGGVFELASIAVQPAWQGQGIGSALIESLLQSSPSPIYLTCRRELGGFYQQFGFQTTPPAVMPPYFRRLWMLTSLLGHILPGGNWLRFMHR